jgi:D-glycero-alpha-D-manno-heptose-7-phosphate kinase
MIITRTPFRVSFAGGGSDLRDFYSRNGYGAVVSTAINKYMYIVIHPYFHDKIRVKYSMTEDVEEVDEIRHPIVRECLRKVQIERGIEIASFADVPAGTGLGSSSAFTVGLLNALYAYKGKVVSKERLAREACDIEIERLGEPIGKQDQYATAYGNINYIRFSKDETVDVTPIFLTEFSRKSLEEKLCLYYTGGERKASDILEEQKRNISNEDKFSSLQKIVNLTDVLRDSLQEGDLDSLGPILHKGWQLKKELSKRISTDGINRLYDKFIKSGAEGGKLLGAGSTGFLLIYSNKHDRLQRFFGLKVLPFNIDREGTKIIFYDQ